MSLSLSLSRLVALWHLNVSLLHLGTLFISGHLLLILPPLTFGSVMRRPVRTSRRTFHDEAFIWNAKSFCQIFLTLTYLLCGVPITCPSMIIQEFCSNMHRFDYSIPLFVTRVRGICMVVTTDIVFEVLHNPKVAHPDYPDCDHLKTVSEDELTSPFCETPSSWGDRQNTLCSTFAKGPRFLNMVMTFILHPLSHYNTITEPRTHFLLSLIEDLSIDFPSHFILSLIDVYRDTTTRDKLIFPSAITQLLCHFSLSYPKSPYFTFMCAIDAASV